MNNDQIKGVANNIAGMIQEEIGKLSGNKEQQAKGIKKQISGKIQKTYGDAKEVNKNTKHP